MTEQGFDSDTRPWETLKQAFLDRVRACATASSAAEMWRLFAADPWFGQQLEARARRILLARCGRLDGLGDVKHDALLALARRLAKTPDLRVKLDLVDRTFPAWIGTILDRACSEAARALGRLGRVEAAVIEEPADPRDKQLVDARIDVSVAIDAQEEPHRTLLWLSAKGYSVPEIAEKLDLTYWEAYDRLQAGRARVERRLASYRQDRSVEPVSPGNSSSPRP